MVIANDIMLMIGNQLKNSLRIVIFKTLIYIEYPTDGT